MIDVKKMRADLKEQLREKINGNSDGKYLKIIQVAGDPASDAYTKGKKRDCEEIGLKCVHTLLPNDVSPADVMVAIKNGNLDMDCVGMILQLPLPAHLAELTNDFLDAIVESKDVDGFNINSPFDPCTPAGIVYIMKKHFGDNLAGRTALIVGRGKLVGKPLAAMLDRENMTIMQANSHTPRARLAQLLQVADVVITATGKIDTIDAQMGLWLRDETLVIDAGISRNGEGKLCGDCNPSIYKIHNNITPVPGGVGLMTRAMLLDNTIRAMMKNI